MRCWQKEGRAFNKKREEEEELFLSPFFSFSLFAQMRRFSVALLTFWPCCLLANCVLKEISWKLPCSPPRSIFFPLSSFFFSFSHTRRTGYFVDRASSSSSREMMSSERPIPLVWRVVFSVKRPLLLLLPSITFNCHVRTTTTESRLRRERRE